MSARGHHGLLLGGGGGTGVKWDATKKHANVSLSGSDKTMSVAAGSWYAVIANKGHSVGKRQFELSSTSSPEYALAGCANALYSNLGTYIGASGTIQEAAGAWFLSGRYVYYNNGATVSNNGGISPGQVLGVALDFDADTIKFYRNGSLIVTMPASFSTLGSQLWFPAASAQKGGNVTLRGSSLVYPIAGYTAWDD